MLKSIFIFFAITLAVSATTYKVGPSQPLKNINDVPWEKITAGDSVQIDYRDASYKEKWVICAQGTKDKPIVVTGIPNRQGKLPVIDGDGATTRKELNFWNEERGIIKIGGANTPKDLMPKHIVIENLDIKTGRPGFKFTGRNGEKEYIKNCAAIYIEKGENITIRNCILSNCGNGLFCGSGTKNLLIEGCYYFDNGIENSYYEHNNYTEALGITFQYNHFGPLRKNCGGNNLKDRSGGCIIRYNWIEGGNRQLDLVHSGSEKIYNDPQYRQTLVYGNILIETEGSGNSQIIHYGGDDSNKENQYRKGTLYLYNNTIFSTRTGNTTLINLSTDDEKADIRNNVYTNKVNGNKLAILNVNGTADLRNNWIKKGWKNSFSSNNTKVNVLDGNIINQEDPHFVNINNMNFKLDKNSPLIDAGIEVSNIVSNYPPLFEYKKHQQKTKRLFDSKLDIGAYEFGTTNITAIPQNNVPTLHLNTQNRIPSLNLSLVSSHIITVTVFDSQGKKYFQSSYKGHRGFNSFQLPQMAQQSSRLYILVVTIGNHIISQKMVL